MVAQPAPRAFLHGDETGTAPRCALSFMSHLVLATRPTTSTVPLTSPFQAAQHESISTSGDGGGKAPAIREPRERARRGFLVGAARWLQRIEFQIRPAEINGQPGNPPHAT